MREGDYLLTSIFEGWDGYQTSLLHAIQPLARPQLEWRPRENLRSIGETAGHIALGRIDWFSRMGAPGSHDLVQQANKVRGRYSNFDPTLLGDSAELVDWLELSWNLVAATLRVWRVSDLSKTFAQEYSGKTYAVSYQWVIWRIITHDVQHGGEIALMLGMQGLPAPELGDLGGHLTEPPVIQD
jgi:uncharacterized damage-inducible protein DinB